MKARDFLAHLSLANQLTFLRLVAVPFFIIALLESRFATAFALFVGAAITDLLDGLSARILGQQSVFGAYLDPAADKLLLTTAFILLTDYPSLFQSIDLMHRIPIWLTILTISRDVLIVCVALLLYLSHQERWFPPSVWGKLNTLAETVTISLFLLLNTLRVDHASLDVMVWTTLALTFVSGFHYLYRTTRALRAEGVRTGKPGA
jgi:cardiolipin synthase